MKQKLALACTLVHAPQVLLLDEPTTGVDPVSRREFWKLLSEFLARGLTIIMATPYLDEAERCGRVALLHDGHLLAIDRPATLQQSAGQLLEVVDRRFETSVRAPRRAARRARRAGIRRPRSRPPRSQSHSPTGRDRSMTALRAAGLRPTCDPCGSRVTRRRVHRAHRRRPQPPATYRTGEMMTCAISIVFALAEDRRPPFGRILPRASPTAQAGARRGAC